MHIWGRVGPQAGSDQTFCQQSRIGSGWVNVSPGRVQENWPVDNSEFNQRTILTLSFICLFISSNYFILHVIHIASSERSYVFTCVCATNVMLVSIHTFSKVKVQFWIDTFVKSSKAMFFHYKSKPKLSMIIKTQMMNQKLPQFEERDSTYTFKVAC